jgi:hypothetical protein
MPVNRRRITKEELAKLDFLSMKRTGTDRQHLNDFWLMFAESIISMPVTHSLTKQVKLLIIVTQISGDSTKEFIMANTWLLE